jgi:putative PIN family toxin of toxin-antitoxin system
MKVVFDTNVYVSAFVVPGSKGERAFLLARRGACELYSSVPILTETANKLREKFHQTDDDVKAALKMISRAATIVAPQVRLRILEDDPDNRILECAVASRAAAIVTGDRHLLSLREHEGTVVLRLADFLRMFPEKHP